MGIRSEYFEPKPGDTFICSICHEVFEDPVELPKCQHIFCRVCITDWMTTSATCPIDRQNICPSDCRIPHRYFRERYGNLKVRCQENKKCGMLVRLSEQMQHRHECIAFQTSSLEDWEAKVRENDCTIDQSRKAVEDTYLKARNAKQSLEEKLKQAVEEFNEGVKKLKETLLRKVENTLATSRAEIPGIINDSNIHIHSPRVFVACFEKRLDKFEHNFFSTDDRTGTRRKNPQSFQDKQDTMNSQEKGYDLALFPSMPDKMFTCSICNGVLRDPVETHPCQHFYCRSCILKGWRSRRLCPQDKRPIASLGPPPRLFQEDLGQLRIRCPDGGCTSVVNLEQLEKHQNNECIGRRRKLLKENIQMRQRQTMKQKTELERLIGTLNATEAAVMMVSHFLRLELDIAEKEFLASSKQLQSKLLQHIQKLEAKH